MNVITVQNLKKYYRVYQKEPGIGGAIKVLFKRKYYDAKAVDNISFSIDEGELVGFIGPNGAGKTTTLKCLSGLLYPTSGNVNVLGFDPYRREANFLKKITLVMGQKSQMWWDLPPYESFLLNKEIYQIPTTQFNATVKELSVLLQIEDILKVQVRKLSLGQRMKCELAAALLHSPKVLFLDEPTIGLDVVMQQTLRHFIREYNLKFQATIILTSHYMDDVEALCKRIIIINQGTIIYDGSLADVVKKYAVNKLLTVIFLKPIAKEELMKLGEVKEFTNDKVRLAVPKLHVNEVASYILKRFAVEDITIEDPEIEAIVRRIFSSKRV